MVKLGGFIPLEIYQGSITYPTFSGKFRKSSTQTCLGGGDMLVPRRMHTNCLFTFQPKKHIWRRRAKSKLPTPKKVRKCRPRSRGVCCKRNGCCFFSLEKIWMVCFAHEISVDFQLKLQVHRCMVILKCKFVTKVNLFFDLPS